MKNILPVISLLILLIVLLPSCNKKEDNNDIKQVPINDYLPLKVGSKYKYNYSSSYGYYNEGYIEKGKCTWTFISMSVDTPVVYMAEQSSTGDLLYSNDSGYKDSTHFENQISSLRFEVLKDSSIAFSFAVPYWGSGTATFKRYIQSDKMDTCFILNILINHGCLRKNVGITELGYNSIGNHSGGVSYSLIEGPY